ncbi:bifunctional diguanylate cyclase/phosphodiesterase [Pararhodospirillum oryzae]|uniref:GGDEF domain-containing protein n=1 Tax=Pararhodospirillum oryzae TaxID=478448 RepID=A0A512HAA2_9PROT|nr:bifunctional diguanylate cyclase/phosphodiesterase [Pararhodospirillum oryzae]GEO82384.1 GGDEF domain-containing protein [Pararhodospirillum oryzae]
MSETTSRGGPVNHSTGNAGEGPSSRLERPWFRPRFTLNPTSGPGAGAPAPGEDSPVERDLAQPPAHRRSWSAIVAGLDVALQPVISLSSGRAVGFEALLRNTEPAGFAEVREMQDEAWRTATLEGTAALPREIELAGWRLALGKFATLPDRGDARLYLNLDPRLLPFWPEMGKILEQLREQAGVARTHLALEISERLPVLDHDSMGAQANAVEKTLERIGAVVNAIRAQVGKVALDDFGVGFASLPLLRAVKPDLVKIDRFFVHDAANDQSRKLFLANMANVCHLMGVQVVAKGLESIEDYHACRDAGCDQAQGRLLASPQTDPALLRAEYPEVLDYNASEQRRIGGDQHLVAAQITESTPIVFPASMTEVFERFRQEKSRTFFPVVDATREPMGIVREVDLKEYTYSLYGKDLISNKGLGLGLADFITRCPTVDIATRAEKILEAFSSNSRSEGLIITEDGRYRGFLTASSLLRVINEKNLAAARDQNPLTRLAGNSAIADFLGDALADNGTALTLAYIDFDNFKPFNDKYGFRQGDRAILLFADLMRAEVNGEGVFVGHIGGDDFFAAFRDLPEDEAEARIRALTAKFESDVASFYDEETRARGSVRARDRHGIERDMPLLGASAAVVHLPAGHATRDIDAISGLIATLKKEAKQAPDRLAVATIAKRPAA